jgi:hypothetical protein
MDEALAQAVRERHVMARKHDGPTVLSNLANSSLNCSGSTQNTGRRASASAFPRGAWERDTDFTGETPAIRVG